MLAEMATGGRRRVITSGDASVNGLALWFGNNDPCVFVVCFVNGMGFRCRWNFTDSSADVS